MGTGNGSDASPNLSARANTCVGQGDSRAFIHATMEGLDRVFSKSIVPLFAGVQGKAVQCGTGTLLRIADRQFLVTAAHVCTLVKEHAHGMCIFDDRSGSEAVPLSGSVLMAGGAPDFAIIELRESLVQALPNRRFLSLTDVDLASREPAKGLFCLWGYPSCWYRRDDQSGRISTVAVRLVTALFEGYRENLRDYDPRTHLLFTAPDDTNAFPGGHPESLHGFSGSSVWQVWRQGDPPAWWKPEDAKIIGVQTGVYCKPGALKATRWVPVLKAIWDGFPHLRGAIRLHLDW